MIPSPRSEIVFLLDVDNTLLDNDRLKSDLASAIRRELGVERSERFWEVYEDVRSEEDYVDFPATVKRFAAFYKDPGLAEQLQRILDDIPFSEYPYPGVMETIRHLKTFGIVVILSDGDSVFQPQKIERSGLAAAVNGNVMIFVHKERELAHVYSQYPADHYVVVDDKPRILAALETTCPAEFTTILVLQGKYAHPEEFTPKPDYVVPGIGDLRDFTRIDFLASRSSSPVTEGESTR